jgi:hypothetical protein
VVKERVADFDREVGMRSDGAMLNETELTVPPRAGVAVVAGKSVDVDTVMPHEEPGKYDPKVPNRVTVYDLVCMVTSES